MPRTKFYNYFVYFIKEKYEPDATIIYPFPNQGYPNSLSTLVPCLTSPAGLVTFLSAAASSELLPLTNFNFITTMILTNQVSCIFSQNLACDQSTYSVTYQGWTRNILRLTTLWIFHPHIVSLRKIKFPVYGYWSLNAITEKRILPLLHICTSGLVYFYLENWIHDHALLNLGIVKTVFPMLVVSIYL